LLNLTNYASVNNIVGAGFGLPAAVGGVGSTTFNVSGIKINPTTTSLATPLAFTSAFPMRQFQLGIRIGF